MSELRLKKRPRTEDTETKFTVPPSDLRNKALKYFTDIFCKKGRIPVLDIGKQDIIMLNYIYMGSMRSKCLKKINRSIVKLNI